LTPGLTINETAQISGKLTYTSSSTQTESIQTTPPEGIYYQTPVPNPESTEHKADTIVFQHAERGSAAFIFGLILTWIWRVVKAFITLGVIALLFFWLIPQKFDQSLQMLKEHPGKSFTYGILTLFAGFVLLFFVLIILVSFTAFLAIVTFGTLGFYFFLISFSCYFLILAFFLIFSFVGSKILVAYFVGEWLIKVLSKSAVQGRALPLIVGLVLYVVVGYLPVLGFLTQIIMILFGTGALFLTAQTWWQSRKPAALPAE
jgi:hypothetical protein